MEKEINHSTVVSKNGAPPPKEADGGGAAAHPHFRVLAVFLGIFCILLVVSTRVIIYILTAENEKLMTEKSVLEKQTEELRRVTENLNRTLGVILKFDTFPVNEYCPDKKCQLCQRDWLPFQDKCYLFSENKPWKSWEGSRQYCQNETADLVVVNSLQEQEFIINNTKFYFDVFHGYWLGLYETDDQDWFWIDGRNDTLRYWIKDGLGSPGSRALTFPDRSPTASWRSAKNAMWNRFICEKEALIWSN